MTGALKILALALLIFAAIGGSSSAEVYWLEARTLTKIMPDSTPVTMWGFAQCASGFSSCGLPSVPGPRLTVTPGATLTINLRNSLTGLFTEPVSIVIPGQSAAMTPTWDDGSTGPRANPSQRVRSFTAETPVGGTTVYTWSNFKSGTYLYQSGTHPAVQMQMGLSGAVTADAGPNSAYTPTLTNPNTSFQNELVLVYGEIDPALHNAIATNNYGPPSGPGRITSPVDYNPRYFLVRGEPYSGSQSPLFAGNPGETVIIRFLNAGLETHVPVIQGLYMKVIAEDGNLLPYPKDQYSLMLPAGKTIDAIVTLSVPVGYIPLYDRMLDLSNWMQSPGGMLVYLKIGSVAQQLLTVNKTGSTGTGRILTTSSPGGIECGTDCSEQYNTGTQVRLSAIPDAGSFFSGWSGGGCTGTGDCIVTMNSPVTVTGIFNTLLVVTVPNGGESWAAGTSQTIRWTYSGNPGAAVRIELLKGGVLSSTIAASAAIGTGGNGSYNWAIPIAQTPGINYKVRVTSTTNGVNTDTSNSNFSITGPTGITVTVPNGGESWAAGTLHTIRWTYTGNPGAAVRIELLKGGVLNRTITASAARGTGGNGSFNWTIPSVQAAGTDYRVRVTSTTNGAYTDTSNANFSITRLPGGGAP